MGDAYRTWEKNGVLWPKQLLGEAFPQARIFTYGYDADVVKLFSRVGQGTIYQQSRSLIQAVHRARRDHYQVRVKIHYHNLASFNLCSQTEYMLTHTHSVPSYLSPTAWAASL